MAETKKEVLREVLYVELSIETSPDPKEFFQDSKGLYVWNSFKNDIAAKAEPMKDLKCRVKSFDLQKTANDTEIEAELPEKHLFSESDVCAILADLISRQPTGVDGPLLKNGNWNLFYTGAFVVSVFWGAFGGGWDVGAWVRDDYRWNGGRRVFSPATEPLNS